MVQDILITAYSPLGTPDSPEAGFKENVAVPKPMDDPLINKIAKDLGKSAAQVSHLPFSCVLSTISDVFVMCASSCPVQLLL